MINFCPLPHSLTVTFLLALPPTQYEGRRLNEEVSEDEEGTVLYSLSVCLIPCLSTCKQGGGFQMTGHSHLAGAWWSLTWCRPCTAWAGVSPPQFGLFCLGLSLSLSLTLSGNCIYIYIYIAFGLCVLKCPTRAKYPPPLNPTVQSCLQTSNTWCILQWPAVRLRLNWYFLFTDASIWRRTHSVSNWTPPVDFVFVELYGAVTKATIMNKNILFVLFFFSHRLSSLFVPATSSQFLEKLMKMASTM